MRKLLFILTISIFASCKSDNKDFDASGNFEADEVIVSAQQNGTLLTFDVSEGSFLEKNKIVGQIDVEGQKIQKAQAEATIKAIGQKTVTPTAQVNVAKGQWAAQEAQMQYLQKEKRRLQNLVAADAAPRKQLDDMEAQITTMQRQMAVTREQTALYESNAATQNRSILSEQGPVEKSVEQIQYQIGKGQIVNPVSGTVLARYAMQGELAAIGRPLYKIASLDTLQLKAYITGNQLPQIKLGQSVSIRIDDGKHGYKTYAGTVSWISSKAEFTPKTIQTKSERQNLVYAIKVRVANDGFLKIGMYGEIIFAVK